jgi:hypothetical protein
LRVDLVSLRACRPRAWFVPSPRARASRPVFDVCDAAANGDFAAQCESNCPPKPGSYCPAGPAELFGTRFAVWDTGDDNLDSSVLVDAFRWTATEGTVDVGTEPIPDPK